MAMTENERLMLDALYTILNVETSAKWGAEDNSALYGLDVSWHFAKVRAAIAAVDPRGEMFE